MENRSQDQPVVEPIQGAGATEPGILDKILNRGDTATDGSAMPQYPGEDDCVNCHYNGKTTKLVDSVCPTCGYTKAAYNV